MPLRSVMEKSRNLSGLPIPSRRFQRWQEGSGENGKGKRGKGDATATGRGNLDISAKHKERERLGGFIGAADNGWSSQQGNFFK